MATGKRLAVVVDLRDPAWEDAVAGAEEICRAGCRAAFAAAGGEIADAEVGVVLADDAFVRELNRDYRGFDKPTNVLAFASEDAPGPLGPGQALLLGDIVIARQTLLAEAAEESRPAADHLNHLVIHGMLHLLGFDHMDESEAAEMESLETEILAGLGVADPHAADIAEVNSGRNDERPTSE